MKEIRIAYLLLAHKCPEQINMFIKQLLNYGDCDIYLHIDKKAKNIIPEIEKSENIFIISEYSVSWGSFEIPKAALSLMKLAAASGRKYTHYYFGSCQDLLVKKGMYEFLASNPNNIFLRIHGPVKDKSRASARYKVCWPKKLMIRNDWHPYRFVRVAIQYLCQAGIVCRKNEVKISKDIVFFEGRTWFIAPNAIIEYILDYIENNPEFIKFWEKSLASDLMFFQTIIMNSEYKDFVKDELMYVNFGKTFGTMNHPLNITIQDNEKIEAGNYFCARKFEYNDIDTIKYYLEKTK